MSKVKTMSDAMVLKVMKTEWRTGMKAYVAEAFGGQYDSWNDYADAFRDEVHEYNHYMQDFRPMRVTEASIKRALKVMRPIVQAEVDKELAKIANRF